MIKNQRKIDDTAGRLQLTLVLGLFFPVLLEALFNLSNFKTVDLASAILKTGLLIFFLVVNYLLFEWRKNKLSSRFLDYLNWCYFSVITCYALVFLFFAYITNDDIDSVSSLLEFFYGFVLVGIMYIPVISLGVLLIEFVTSGFKNFK